MPPPKKGDGRPLGKGGGGGPAPKAGAKTKAKNGFAERLADRTRENKGKMTPEQKAENDHKSAEGRKRKAKETAGAPSAKKERVDIKSLPDSEKAKIKCKFWNADQTKNRCTGNWQLCLFKHL